MENSYTKWEELQIAQENYLRESFKARENDREYFYNNYYKPILQEQRSGSFAPVFRIVWSHNFFAEPGQILHGQKPILGYFVAPVVREFDENENMIYTPVITNAKYYPL